MSRRDFYSRLAVIERATGRRIGAAHPADEPVRFTPSTSLAFASHDAEVATEDPREWVTSFLSLAGADGALPPYLAEEIAREDPDRPVRQMLLTPFHHRATALLYRSVHRCRVPEETRSLSDVWPTRLAMLVRGDLGADLFERDVVIALAPLLHGRPSASSLSCALAIISKRWLGGAPIALTERTGGRMSVDESSRARLGASRLGDTAVLGTTVLDPSSRATITIGPLNREWSPSLATGGSANRALACALRWLGDSATEIEVLVRADDARLRIGAAQLGSTRLGSRRGKPRERTLRIGATDSGTARQELSKDGTTRPPKELSCDPIPESSFNG